MVGGTPIEHLQPAKPQNPSQGSQSEEPWLTKSPSTRFWWFEGM